MRTETLEIRRNNFMNCIVDPEEVVNAPSLNSFRNRLDKCGKTTQINLYKPMNLVVSNQI